MFSSRSKGIHNHIQSLGIGAKGEIEDTPESIVGQNNARLAGNIIVDIVKSNILGGKCFVLSGPSGCGKTALTVAIGEELGTKIPFISVSGYEVYSSEVKKTEVLEGLLRKAVLVRIKEYKNVYEGEVTSFANSVIDLRSLKGTKSLRLSQELIEQMTSQSVKIGDVIHIDSSSGIIKRLGRGESHLNDYDLEADRYVPLPKNEIYKKREFIHETSLHNLDMSNINPTGQDVLSLVHQIVKYKKSEVSDKLRRDVDKLIDSYKNVDIVYGILLIEDAHILDEECFFYLCKAMDSEKCPVILLTTNTGNIPNFFLRRCMIINMEKNKKEEEILKIRIEQEKLEIDSDGFDSLLKLSNNFGLNYAINILKMLKILERKISKKDVEEFSNMFKNK